MVERVKAHEARAGSSFEDIEVAKSMPSSWASAMRTATATVACCLRPRRVSRSPALSVVRGLTESVNHCVETFSSW